MSIPVQFHLYDEYGNYLEKRSLFNVSYGSDDLYNMSHHAKALVHERGIDDIQKRVPYARYAGPTCNEDWVIDLKDGTLLPASLMVIIHQRVKE